jgi:pyrroline-5-carboxylate reductase
MEEKMNNKIGFIGCGNMAQAMINGIVKSGLTNPINIMASNPGIEKLNSAKEKYGIQVTSDNSKVAAFADILILAVKPDKYETVIKEIKDIVRKETVIVIIAAGITTEFICKHFERNVMVVRAMPNTSAAVGESMSALSKGKYVTKDNMDAVVAIFESFGRAEIIDEKLMDAVPAISGSSPAYVYMFIEALADGGVLSGIPRKQAYIMAAQAVLGAAKMVLETHEHPGVLKDNVCSPGGTTIEAVYTLEQNNFRGTVISAMNSCTRKTKEMSK